MKDQVLQNSNKHQIDFQNYLNNLLLIENHSLPKPYLKRTFLPLKNIPAALYDFLFTETKNSEIDAKYSNAKKPTNNMYILSTIHKCGIEKKDHKKFINLAISKQEALDILDDFVNKKFLNSSSSFKYLENTTTPQLIFRSDLSELFITKNNTNKSAQVVTKDEKASFTKNMQDSGSYAENFVFEKIKELNSKLFEQVKKLSNEIFKSSMVEDTFNRNTNAGYDIKITSNTNKEFYFEVKSIASRKKADFFISSNEYSQALENNNYYFILYSSDEDIWVLNAKEFLSDSRVEKTPTQYQVRLYK